MMGSNSMDKLINAVLAQIKEDIVDGDMTSIEELLRHTPEVSLLAYLPEEQWADHATPEPTKERRTKLALAMMDEGRVVETGHSTILIEVCRDLFEEFKGEEE
jgi:hypothetical protein